MKKLREYESELEKRILARVGEVEEFLRPQIEVTAKHQMLLDKFFDELMAGDLTMLEVGSMGQSKMVINPLVAQYEKMHRSVTADLEALGLNYRTTPSKVTESTKKGLDEEDPLVKLYKI
jgi:hypothetical protein